MVMDERVLQAKARWPNVPAAWGWLYLDRRGAWRLIDRGAPGFDPVRDGRGDPIRHEALIDFISRNYACLKDGSWFFQNGPQRVFVDLELAPRIWRLAPQSDGIVLVAHTGEIASRVERIGVDSDGVVWAQTDLGPGAIDDRQLAALLDQVDPEDVPQVSDHPTEVAGSFDLANPVVRIRFRGHPEPLPLTPFTQSAALEFGFLRQPREQT
jgi:hypothetical protein